MNTKGYIESGVIEQYVLDLLTDAERLEVEANARQYPTVKNEIGVTEDALKIYSYSRAITPPAQLKALILEKARASRRSDSSPSPGASNDNFWKLFTLFGVLGTITGLLFSYNFAQQKDTAEAQLNSTQNQMALLDEACEKVREENGLLNQRLNVIRSTTTKVIRMKGTDNAPNAIATIFYDQTAQKSYLDINSLPTPPSDKQYQLWAIVDGTPVDMGVFDIATGFKEVDFITNPQAFAVTLETLGGNPTPNLEALTTYGEAG